MSEEAQQEVVRFYTSTRRVPKMIGKLGNGEMLLGGPYTLAQVGWAAGLFSLLFATRGSWDLGGVVNNVTAMLALPLAVGFFAGKIPSSGRNPIPVLGLLPAAFGASGGRYRDRIIRLPRPHSVEGATLLDLPSLSGSAPERTVFAAADCASQETDSGQVCEAGEMTPLNVRNRTGRDEPDYGSPVPMSSVARLLADASQRN